ncbi:MAG: homoserine dehydrogenase [Dehalococcoidia bacterium]|nr:MAG: homoserine dehydrogenase [Dehalococcoidia bacterium]
MENKTIGIGLMGLGVIGGQVARVLTERSGMLAEHAGFPLILRKIKVIESDLTRPQAQAMERSLFTIDEEEFFNTPGLDIIVEVIGGEHPAFEYQKRALKSGKHVVTANKEVIAKHGAELLALAAQNRVSLRYEASVGGGIPLIAPFQRDLIANRINGIYAIINGTTNFILSTMAREGTEFATALGQAQKLGYAETNPRNDLEGIDAAYKIAILATLAFRSRVRPDQVFHEGISRLSRRDFRYARELGFAIKLLAIAKQSDSEIEVRVHPVFIPADCFLAKVDGVYNAVQVDGDLTGQVTFLGKGAGALPTSSAVVADVVAAARHVASGQSGSTWQPGENKRLKPMSQIVTRYYIRMGVTDQPGVLAQIAFALGSHQISIASVIQKETEPDQTAEIVIMTHPAREEAMQAAFAEFKKLPVVKEVHNFVRVEA